jgi:L-gulono-1,4-lactone dehydrogenase
MDARMNMPLEFQDPPINYARLDRFSAPSLLRMRSLAALLLTASCGALALEWRNWDQLQVCSPQGFTRPSTEAEVARIVTTAASKGNHVRLVGAGHSFSPICLTNGVMIQLDGMQQPLSVKPFNPSRPWTPGNASVPASGDALVTVQAGMRVYQLNAYLESKGLALPNTGAIAQQSVAGATATSTHGTGRDLGSMATAIAGMRLILANGSSLDVDGVSQRPDIFKAARVSLGAFGVVIRVTVHSVPLFKLRRVSTPYLLDDLLPWVYPTVFQQQPRMQWYYTPYTNNATLLLREEVPWDTPITGCWNSSDLEIAWRDPVNAPQLREQVDPSLVEVSSGPFGYAVGSHPAIPPPRWVGSFPSPAGPSAECVDVSYKTLTHSTDDYDLYEEMEIFVPTEVSQTFIQDFLAFQNANSPPPNESAWAPYSLFTGMRYVAADDIPLSMMNGRDTGVVSFITLGNHTRTGPPTVFAFFAQQLEKMGKQWEGRWHWGKMNWATASDTQEVYPELSQYLAVRSELDPTQVFMNDYLSERLPV